MKRCLLALLIFLLVFPTVSGKASPLLQTAPTTSEERALDMLSRMTPEERVGQLFLVSFYGPEAGPGSPTGNQIYDLIFNYHIGGVVLIAENDNFVGYDNTISVARSLTDQLQLNEYNASQKTQINPISGETFTPVYIPIFVGISQDGDGYPYDEILSGMTPLPSQMAQGATWQPELARQVGLILGQELAALGINLLLGPSLDVLEAPYSESGGDLGIRVFGGDPYWVGEMGRAYIRGVHQGSSGQLAVIAKHFPGFGGSDRLPEEEVATVRKSLEQLKQIELAPFMAVTGNAPDAEATSDGLLTSHIRYQGFQGNIRRSTKPVSFDPQAFSALMSLPAFDTWRANGGVMVSDDLGSKAVRRFIDPTGETYDGRFVARDAFLAGNDLLHLGNFVSSGDLDSYTTILDTLGYFSQKYREDTAFAQRVDESVVRILALKYRIYGNTFSLNQTLPPENAVNQLGQSDQIDFDIARNSATLISPDLEALNAEIPDPPSRDDQIIFLTDTRIYQQCSNCRQEYVLAVDALEQAVLRLYSGGGQVLPGNLDSFTFEELQNMIEAGTGVVGIENNIRQAEWLVFSMLNMTPGVPTSMALRNFLNQRPDLYQGKKLLVFAFNAPYYLDATEISKLTAYYALYSRSEKFVEIAARLLFKEIQPLGVLPVSVPGIGYDLIEATLPDPNQIIPLGIENLDSLPADPTPTPELTPMPLTRNVGDTVSVLTGIIYDQNGHQVPDGTIVRFILTQSDEGGAVSQQTEAMTYQGVARATFLIDSGGTHEIRAESDPALSSDVIVIEVPPEGITPTPPPTETVTPTEQPTSTPTPTNTPTASPTPTVIITPVPPATTTFTHWLLSLLIALTIATANYGLANLTGRIKWGLRAGLISLISGLLFYSYLAIGLPGSEEVIRQTGIAGITFIVIIGAGFGSLLAWLLHYLQRLSSRARL